jgi:branched-subunit amino acid ABC-type transport system permease component
LAESKWSSSRSYIVAKDYPRVALHTFLQVVDGLSQGSALFLVALGLSLTLGIMKLVNISNGAFYMLGAYVSTLAIPQMTISAGQMVLAIAIGGIIAGMVGAAVEVSFIRRLYSLPHLFPLLGTYAVLLTIQGVAVIAWGVEPRPTKIPEVLEGILRIGGYPFSVYALLLIGVGLAFAVLIGSVLNWSRFGRLVAAVTDDREMAAMLGINTKRTFLVMFAMSAFAAGVGGGLLAPLNGLTPEVASTYVVEAFAVVIVGGVGSVMGTYIASLVLGVLQSVLVVIEPSMAEVSIYLAMAAMMLLRPRGLFGR